MRRAGLLVGLVVLTWLGPSAAQPRRDDLQSEQKRLQETQRQLREEREKHRGKEQAERSQLMADCYREGRRASEGLSRGIHRVLVPWFDDVQARAFERDLRAEMPEYVRDHKEAVSGRVRGEREILAFGNSVGWDREKVLDKIATGREWLQSREEFGAGLDKGTIRGMAEVYDRVGRDFGI